MSTSRQLQAHGSIRSSVSLADITNRQIRRGVHRSTTELETAIRTYIDGVNTDPKPFKWTKSADDILASIKQFCLATLKTARDQNQIKRTSESGHECEPNFLLRVAAGPLHGDR